MNKIDLPASDPERIKLQIEAIIGINASKAILISAKTGVGISELLKSIVKKNSKSSRR